MIGYVTQDDNARKAAADFQRDDAQLPLTHYGSHQRLGLRAANQEVASQQGAGNRGLLQLVQALQSETGGRPTTHKDLCTVWQAHRAAQLPDNVNRRIRESSAPLGVRNYVVLDAGRDSTDTAARSPHKA